MAKVTVEKNSYTVDPLYQWDINQELVIYGLSLATIPEIHFTNDAMDKAIVRQATMNDAGVITAQIPNSMLQKPYKIKAYVCIYEGDTFKSLYLITIPVEARSMPMDYTLTVSDNEVYSFNALENKIDNVLTLSLEKFDQAYKDYIDASSMSNSASESMNYATYQFREAKQAYDDVMANLSEGDRVGPIIVNSIDECTDTTKLYVLPDGSIYKYDYPILYTNVVDTTSDDWIDDGVLSTSGNVETNSSLGIVTNYIPVKVGDIIRVQGLNLYYNTDDSRTLIQAYDKDKVVINYTIPSSTISEDATYGCKDVCTYDSNNVYTYTILEIGDGTQQSRNRTISYIRINAPLENKKENVIITVNEDIVNTTAKQWVKIGYSYLTDQKLKKWSDKKWVCMGDHTTVYTDYIDKHYHDYIADETGISVIPIGFDDSGYFYDTNNVALWRHFDDIPSDTDVVTIFGCHSDLYYSDDFETDLGSITDNAQNGQMTICGRINYLIDSIKETYPEARLGIITPIPVQQYYPKYTTSIMENYCNAIIEICKIRGIPCLDLYHCSGLTPWSYAYREKYCYIPDSDDSFRAYAPNELGHEIIASKIKTFLDSLIL